LVAAIQQDVYGMGFCRINDIVDATDQSWLENICILPIDKNNNGKLDYFENFYLNLNEFTRAVWIGKYPKTLVNNFYVAAEKSPENKTEIAFLKWIIDDGQSQLAANGFTELVSSEKLAAMNKINHENLYMETTNTENYAFLKMITILVILSGLVALGLLINNTLTNRKDHRVLILNKPDHTPKTITESVLNLPDGIFFDKTHTWVFMEKDGTVKVGIDDFLQRITGPYTRVKMKNPEESLKKNESLITLIQDGKQLDVYAPISGKIISINEKLLDDPSTINASPYADGWVYMIKPSNYLREVQFLRMSEKYREWLRNEIARLKDFLAVSANMKSLQLAQISYQDGGEIINHVLREFGPEVWEDFQKKFIETSVIN
jgi:glycine cleavage system H lipoate-binding protein